MEGNAVHGPAKGRGGTWLGCRHAPAVRAAACAAAVGLMLVAGSHPHAWGQTNTQAKITVAATLMAEPATQVAFPISVGPPDAVPRNSFLRLRGLPTMAALSEGHSIAPGAWAVSLSMLGNLKITLPAGAAGRSDIVITLVALDGSVLAEEKATLTIGAARADRSQPRDLGPAGATILRASPPPGVIERSAPSPQGSPQPPAPPAAAQSAPPPLTPQDRERAQRLMQKGDEQLTQGDVAGARLFYERAADVGLAQAAMALAATFDAAELGRLKVRGIQPDAKAARRWYERARQLGASGVEERLRRVGGS